MTVDAVGNLHSTTDGRFAGHLQSEGDPAELIGVPQLMTRCGWCEYPARGTSTFTDGSTYPSCGRPGCGPDGSFVFDPNSDPIDDKLRGELTEWLSYRTWLGTTDQGDRHPETYAENWEESNRHAHDIVMRLAEKLGLPTDKIKRCPSCGEQIEAADSYCVKCDPSDDDDEPVVGELFYPSESAGAVLQGMRGEHVCLPRGQAAAELGAQAQLFKGVFTKDGIPMPPGTSPEEGYVKARTEDDLKFVPFSKLAWWRTNGDLPFHNERER